MISNVPELLKPLFVCMGVVKANVIDFCYSPDLSHLNEDEQHVWGYHWNGLSLVIFPTQHVRRVPKLGVMEVKIFYDLSILSSLLLKKCIQHLFQYKPHPISCSMHEFNDTTNKKLEHHTHIPLGVCSSSKHGKTNLLQCIGAACTAHT